jgi:tight adherence protein B
MNTTFLSFAVLLFVATVLAIEGMYLIWNGHHGPLARRIKARLAVAASREPGGKADLSILKERALGKAPWAIELLSKMPGVYALDRQLKQAGLTWKVGSFFAYSAASGFIGVALGLALRLPFLIAFAIGLACAALPLLHVRRTRAKRLIAIERQLPDAADIIARALRAGHSFASALGMLGNELSAPLGTEFRTAFDEINYGVSMNDALYSLAERVPLDDLRYFVIAVLIQRESGGNLAEILTNISLLTRERLKLLAKVRVLSAEGRFSAWILALLPFVVVGLLSVLNPAFIRVFWTDPAAMKLAGICLGNMVLGILWMRKIIRIRV